MTIKTAFVAMVLAFAPGLAFAQCSSRSAETSSCSDGMVWDATAMTCIVPISS